MVWVRLEEGAAPLLAFLVGRARTKGDWRAVTRSGPIWKLRTVREHLLVRPEVGEQADQFATGARAWFARYVARSQKNPHKTP